MRRILRSFGRACIWAAAFQLGLFLLLWVTGEVLEIERVRGFWDIMFMVAVGMLGAIAQDISHATLPPLDDKEF